MINFLKRYGFNTLFTLLILSGICLLWFTYFHDILFFGITRESLLFTGYSLLVVGLSILIGQRITHYNEEKKNRIDSFSQKVNEQKDKKKSTAITQDEKILKSVALYETYLFHSLSVDQQLIKQILTASFFAIGFMVTLLYNSDEYISIPMFVIWAMATFLFLASFCMLLWNLLALGKLYRAILENRKEPDSVERKIKKYIINASILKLDPWIYLSFVLAIILSVAFVFFSYLSTWINTNSCIT